MICFIPNTNAKKLKLNPRWPGNHLGEAIPEQLADVTLASVIELKYRSYGKYYFAVISIIDISAVGFHAHYDPERQAEGLRLIRQNYRARDVEAINGELVRSHGLNVAHGEYTNGETSLSIFAIDNAAIRYMENPDEVLAGPIFVDGYQAKIAEINELFFQSLRLIHRLIPVEKLKYKNG